MEKLFKNLELNMILEQVASYCATQTSKEQIINYNMLTNKNVLEDLHEILKSAVDISYVKGRFPISGYIEVAAFIQHAQKGGVLREGALLSIATDLRIIKQIKQYLLPQKENNERFPVLEEFADELYPIVRLEKSISQAIISETEIDDHASPQLYDIRRKIRNANSSIKDKLNSIINSQNNKKYLQDAIITIRNGRYVVPVKNENRSQINGIVHDSSSTGMTLFIEPMSVVTLNNQLRELENEELKEIERILKELSEYVHDNAEVLLNNERVVLLLDEYFAKAEYAILNGHSKPDLVEARNIHLRDAYHPLIPKAEVVASDIYIGDGYTQVVITGPNTGGKTVTLKTLGLCCLMSQCGLFIPAGEGSSLCIFDKIFADIGDEQSIAQSLSTFSSHMTNIISILSQEDEHSLVLLDELGAGTDPSEGAALAWAILTKIKSSGALSLATTHYNEIKQYALITEGVVNASVEFDVINLKPTYKLNIGLPGKSNAFEISRRLGLTEDILSEAGEVLTKDSAEFEDILTQLQNKLKAAQDSYERAEALSVENNRINQSLREKQQALQQNRDRMMTEAALDAKKIINESKKRAKDILAEADRYVQSTAKNIDKNRIEELTKDALNQINIHIPTHEVLKQDQKKSDYKFNKSDEVYIPDLKAEGIILDLDDEQAFVQVGAIKTKIALSKLEPQKKKKQKSYAYTGMRAQSFSPRLDIRGITATEVPIEVEKFLDDAALAGVQIVTIVHGKGDGILRKAVDGVLRSHPTVQKFRIGGLKEGGEGATIAYLE